MKKLLFMLLLFTCAQLAFAGDNALDIKVRINGASADNRYFLCMRDVGCLSILGSERGKVFPIFHPVTTSAIYVMDIKREKLTPQGLPASCKGTVNENHTLNITGSLVTNGNSAHVSGLHCSISA